MVLGRWICPTLLSVDSWAWCHIARLGCPATCLCKCEQSTTYIQPRQMDDPLPKSVLATLINACLFATAGHASKIVPNISPRLRVTLFCILLNVWNPAYLASSHFPAEDRKTYMQRRSSKRGNTYYLCKVPWHAGRHALAAQRPSSQARVRKKQTARCRPNT